MGCEALQRVCKPHIVDLLRHFDQRRYLAPRIRYASVRSKPELIDDLNRHFNASVTGGLVLLQGKSMLAGRLPSFAYCTQNRTWLVDGQPRDFPHLTRERPNFQIVWSPVRLTFRPEAMLPLGAALSS